MLLISGVCRAEPPLLPLLQALNRTKETQKGFPSDFLHVGRGGGSMTANQKGNVCGMFLKEPLKNAGSYSSLMKLPQSRPL